MTTQDDARQAASQRPPGSDQELGPIWSHMTQRQRVQATLVRFISVGFFVLFSVIFMPRYKLVWGAMIAYLVLAGMAVALEKTSLAERFVQTRVIGFVLLDVGVVTLMVLATGPAVSPVPVVYLLLVVSYTLQRGARYGVATLILSCVGLGTVLVLENQGITLWNPAEEAGGNPVSGAAAAWGVFSITVLVMVASVTVMSRTVRRQTLQYRQERRLRVAAEAASERSEQLQAQLEHSQRLEGLGRLAGGVAHDFNNLLTGIMGYTDIVHRGLDDGDKHKEDLAEVLTAGRRAQELTAQLLAFGRKQVVQPRRCVLGEIVADSENMLGRLIGEDVQLVTSYADQGHVILADRGQISQVLVNLVVNARDAMPDGGKLQVEVDACTLNEQEAAGSPDLEAGVHVRLQVTDDGIGMAQETLDHLFEPFFSTKGPGKGTGLGLSTVYGIVSQSGGAISVHSKPGEGSCFRICYPVAEGRPSYDIDDQVPVKGGTETILLIEDDAIVRNVTCQILTDAGYTVIVCDSGEQAIKEVSEGTGSIHLLLSDVILTGMNGREAARHIQEHRPEIRVLFMSGYTDDTFRVDFTKGMEVPLLPKPFRSEDLLLRVRQTLDRRIARWTMESL